MKFIFKAGTANVIFRIFLPDATNVAGAGKTGLTNASSGLRIGTIAENEAAGVDYTAAGSTIETVATLGTYATPTATKCRFREVDAVYHPGLYEIQLDVARLSITGAKSLIICIQQDSIPPTFAEIELTGSAASNFLDADLGAIQGSPADAGTFGASVQAIARGTVAAGSTTTTINTSALVPALTDANQLKGRIVIFDRATASTGLRGQATDITASTTGGVLTVSALSSAPAAADSFGVY